VDKLDHIGDMFKNKMKRWGYDEIGSVEKTLCYLCLYEIIYQNLPYKIAINESVEIAKKYGDINTHRFLNGVLKELLNE
jgi:N utilization substance protein B